MIRSSRPARDVLLLVMLVIITGAWLVMAAPAWAQSEDPAPPSAARAFFDQPDLIAPLVIPMVLVLGALLTLMAFLAWVLSRMPEDGEGA